MIIKLKDGTLHFFARQWRAIKDRTGYFFMSNDDIAIFGDGETKMEAAQAAHDGIIDASDAGDVLADYIVQSSMGLVPII